MGHDERETARAGLNGPGAGLEAAELDLLRSAPDYDAEEMASVRPIGGWAAALPAAADLAEPPLSSWRPPNRVEPPARAAVAPDAAEAAAGTRTRFPEERTVALMAEDLLGRPLDEPEPAAPVVSSPAATRRPAWSAATGGADLWDSAMPLMSEGME